MRRSRRGATSVLVAVAAAGLLVGCGGSRGTNGSSGSRVQIYESLDAMVDDSDLVLVGTAGDQRVVSDGEGSAMTSTLTGLTIEDVVRADDATSAGSTATVRQVTTAKGWTSSEPESPLRPGERYLLFLNHSGLPGEASADLFPVGVVAGIYRADGDAFTRIAPDSGDDLPMTLTAEHLRP